MLRGVFSLFSAFVVVLIVGCGSDVLAMVVVEMSVVVVVVLHDADVLEALFFCVLVVAAGGGPLGRQGSSSL